MKNKVTNLLLALLFIGGLGLMLYPTISDLINKHNQSTAIATYEKASDKVKKEERLRMLQEAYEFNKRLPDIISNVNPEKYQENAEYLSMLKVENTDVMAVIDIDKVDIHLPIYHGVGEAVLQIGAGHIATTSLPVGGEGTHAVLSAHTGLPSAKLFTEIDRLELGDIFKITVLGQVLVYEVDNIQVVLPHEIDSLGIVEGEDYVTLVTCTPYGINTHRLLVRGKRMEYEVAKEAGHLVENDAVFVDKTVLIPFAVVPFLILYFAVVAAKKRKNKSSQ